MGETIGKLQADEHKQQVLEAVSQDLERLRQQERFQGMAKYAGYFYDEPASLLDYLGQDGYIILDEMSRIQETANRLDEEEAEWHQSLLEAHQTVRQLKLSFDWHEVLQRMKQARLYLSVFLRHIPNTHPQNIVNVTCRAMQQFHGQMHLLKNELERWEKAIILLF